MEYGTGHVVNEAEKNRRQAAKPSTKWFQVSGGKTKMFIDGTDCPAALINHECGQYDDCPANVQLQKDADTGRIWVVSIKNIPGPVGGKLTWLALDYNFPETGRLATAESEAWWRKYMSKLS